jgi:hypothetical protein
MIKGINAGSPYLTVSGGTSSTYINNYSGTQGVGNVRYNTSSQSMEVYDGNNWQMLNMSYATVDLSYDSQQLLEWARKERNRQFEREEKMKNNPALQKAMEAIKRAEDNFDLIYKFVEHDTQSESEGVQSSP